MSFDFPSLGYPSAIDEPMLNVHCKIKIWVKKAMNAEGITNIILKMLTWKLVPLNPMFISS